MEYLRRRSAVEKGTAGANAGVVVGVRCACPIQVLSFCRCTASPVERPFVPAEVG